MKETAAENNSENITLAAFQETRKIFESFEKPNPATTDRRHELRRRVLDDGSRIEIYKERIDEGDDFDMFKISVYDKTPIGERELFSHILFFSLDRDGLRRIETGMNLNMGESKIPIAVEFSTDDHSILDDSVEPFSNASKDLVEWLAKVVKENKLSEPPILIKF